MQKFRFIAPMLACTMLIACSHESEMVAASVPAAHYALQSQKGAEQVTTPGFVSRYQRELLVQASNEEYLSSPAAQNFDHIMDHLETLMAPQIEENNRIALMQQRVPGYRF